MAVIISSDKTLNFLVHSREYAVVKYTKADCAVCTTLQPVYDALSNGAEYSEILFLTIDADKNTTANLFLAGRETPMVVSYRTGVVYEFKTATSKESIEDILDSLLKAPNLHI